MQKIYENNRNSRKNCKDRQGRNLQKNQMNRMVTGILLAGSMVLTPVYAKNAYAESAGSTENAETIENAESTAGPEELLQEQDSAVDIADAGAIDLSGINAENYPKVDGSTATLPLSTALYQLVCGCSVKEADEAIVHTKTTNSWLQLIAGETELLIVADKNDVVNAAMEEAGVSLDIQEIALDAFIFLTNEENPVESLTQDQLVGIYDGSITNWQELGGEDKEILAFQRNANAGSQTAMKKLVMKDHELMEAKELEISTMSDLLTAVAAYNNSANAIGYSYYYYAYEMMTTPGTRFMKVDGILPSAGSVQDGSYPYVTGYYAVVRSDAAEDSPERILYNWLGSPKGQELIADLGYIPVDSTISTDHIHSEIAADTELPLGKEEYLILTPGNNTVLAVNAKGAVTDRFENAEYVSDYTSEASVVDGTKPIILGSMTESGYKYGLYSLALHSWITKPQYDLLRRLGDGLYTDSNIESAGGCLMDDQGNVIDSISEDSYGYYVLLEDHILKFAHIYDNTDGYYSKSRSSVYNKDGSLVFDVDGQIQAISGSGYYVVSGNDDRTYLYYSDGRVEECQTEGYTYCGIYHNYLFWTDFSENGMITDTEGNRVLDKEILAERNPGAELPDYYEMKILWEDEKSGRRFLTLEGYGYSDVLQYYTQFFTGYLCDKNWKILKEYPDGSFSCVSSGYGTVNGALWLMDKEKGAYRISSLGENEVFQIPLSDIDYTNFSVSSCGDLKKITARTEDWSQLMTKLYLGGKEISLDSSFWQEKAASEGAALSEDAILALDEMNRLSKVQELQIFEIEEGIWRIFVYSYNFETEVTKNINLYYSAEKGFLLPESGEILYADDQLSVVLCGSYYYVEAADGKLLLRILAQDEEIDQRESMYFVY